MQMTTLGNTGLKVSRLGAGLAAILTLAEVVPPDVFSTPPSMVVSVSLIRLRAT